MERDRERDTHPRWVGGYVQWSGISCKRIQSVLKEEKSLPVAKETVGEEESARGSDHRRSLLICDIIL